MSLESNGTNRRVPSFFRLQSIVCCLVNETSILQTNRSKLPRAHLNYKRTGAKMPLNPEHRGRVSAYPDLPLI